MSPVLLLPLAVSLLVATGSGVLQSRLRPSTAAWVLTVAASLSAAAALASVAMVLVNLAHAAGRGEPAWRLHAGMQPVDAPWVEAGVAIAWAVIAAIRVRRCRDSYRQASPTLAFGAEIEIIDGLEPLAYALPGRRGHIVVSTSMLARLSPREQEVLFAHERSHRRHRHDRFVHAVDLVAAAIPTLSGLSRRVRFATERWADEEAAASVGDRRLAARAVARAALARTDVPQIGLALAGLGVRARVEALLAPPPSRGVAGVVAGLSGLALAIVVLSTALQLHHLGRAAAQFCWP